MFWIIVVCGLGVWWVTDAILSAVNATNQTKANIAAAKNATAIWNGMTPKERSDYEEKQRHEERTRFWHGVIQPVLRKHGAKNVGKDMEADYKALIDMNNNE